MLMVDVFNCMMPSHVGTVKYSSVKCICDYVCIGCWDKVPCIHEGHMKSHDFE